MTGHRVPKQISRRRIVCYWRLEWDADGWKSVKPFLAEHKLNYPVVIGNDDLGEEFGLVNMPLTLLIDRNGNIAESHAGVVDKESFEAKIRTLLQENATKQ